MAPIWRTGRRCSERAGALCGARTFKVGIDHDVQVLPGEGAQVPGHGVQADVGVVQGEANAGVFHPRQAAKKGGEKEKEELE